MKIGGFYVIDDMIPQPNWPDRHAEKSSALIEKGCSFQNFPIGLVHRCNPDNPTFLESDF
jgi:hypothetical protein